MFDFNTIFSFLGASGFAAAMTSIFSQGRLHQRVESHQALINKLSEDHRQTAASHGGMAVALGRVEERMNTIKDDLTEIKAAVRKEI